METKLNLIKRFKAGRKEILDKSGGEEKSSFQGKERAVWVS
jgi:hypothetical protein